MKRTLQVVIALAISSLFLASPVAAATNQGLSWGVHLHDRLGYTIVASGSNSTVQLNEACYFNITADPPAIPDSMTDWNQVPQVDLAGWWANGTTIGAYAGLFILLLFLGSHFVVPIGNYTLLEELIQTDFFWNVSTVFVSDSIHWGMRLVDYSPEVNSTLEVSYLKSDGALATYGVTTINNTSHTTLASLQVTRGSTPLDLVGWLRENILLVGAGVLVIVIVGAVVCMKRK